MQDSDRCLLLASVAAAAGVKASLGIALSRAYWCDVFTPFCSVVRYMRTEVRRMKVIRSNEPSIDCHINAVALHEKAASSGAGIRSNPRRY